MHTTVATMAMVAVLGVATLQAQPPEGTTQRVKAAAQPQAGVIALSHRSPSLTAAMTEAAARNAHLLAQDRTPAQPKRARHCVRRALTGGLIGTGGGIGLGFVMIGLMEGTDDEAGVYGKWAVTGASIGALVGLASCAL